MTKLYPTTIFRLVVIYGRLGFVIGYFLYILYLPTIWLRDCNGHYCLFSICFHVILLTSVSQLRILILSLLLFLDQTNHAITLLLTFLVVNCGETRLSAWCASVTCFTPSRDHVRNVNNVTHGRSTCQSPPPYEHARRIQSPF